MNTVNPNHQKAVSIVKFHIIKRLKASLKGAELEKALFAVTGEKPQEEHGKIKLSAALRKKLLHLVQSMGGTLVLTGKKKLRIYTYQGYCNAISAGTANMKKHGPQGRAASLEARKEEAPVNVLE